MRAIAGLAFLGAMGATLIAKLDADALPAASTAAIPAPAVIEAPPSETQITIVLTGDTGLNASHQPVFASFATKGGRRLQWSDATSDIAREIDGDINFANLETVVTDRNDIEPNLKLFAFRTHPDGVRHLMATGFNLFSTANNHAMDFGLEGARETLRHLDRLGAAHAGLGRNRGEARTPRLIPAKDRQFALAAVGLIGSAYTAPAEGEERPGQLSYASDRDFNEAVASLAAAMADYRVLSVHYGPEFDVRTSAADRRRLTRTIARGVDLVVGHHHHVVAGIEIVDGAPVFYGLGNFLHWGTQDMSRFDLCRDYGLIARLHLTAANGEKPKLRAIEAIPITAMHKRPRRLPPEDARTRIHVLNHLADQFEARGARFAALTDGTGLYCTPGAEKLPGTLGDRCHAAVKVEPPPPKLAAEIEAACARRVVRVVENEDGLEPVFERADFEPALLPEVQSRR